MEARLGIISPTGDAYFCAYGCHADLANRLCDSHNLREEDCYDLSTDILYSKGWIILSSTMDGELVIMNRKMLVSAQRETLDAILTEFLFMNEPEYIDALKKNPENHKVNGWPIVIKDFEKIKTKIKNLIRN